MPAVIWGWHCIVTDFLLCGMSASQMAQCQHKKDFYFHTVERSEVKRQRQNKQEL